MSWTQERVERLSKLWIEGLSASQIASDLGGVTRNAVIGKVHRLGLSGRAAQPAADAEAESSTAEAATMAAEAQRVESCSEAAPLQGAASFESRIDIEPAPQPSTIGFAGIKVQDVALPPSGRVTLLELSAAMCRWPLGDPTSTEFRFCGCRITSGLPYCAEHARVAFQPVVDRRRTERMLRLA